MVQQRVRPRAASVATPQPAAGSSLRVGVIGYGAIGRPLVASLAGGQAPGVQAVAVLVRETRRHDAPPDGVFLTEDRAAFLQVPSDLIVEAGGHSAVREHGEAALAAGRDLMVVSVGAFADDSLLRRLEAAARGAGRQVLLPSGAIAGLDAIGAARLGGLDEVTITSSKPLEAWRGTPAEAQALAATAPLLLYEGSARAGVALFPQNVNVAAAVSLAGLGLDATRMRVFADPTIQHNTHEVYARGAFGELRLTLKNVPSPDNPKTGRIVALSILKALRQRVAPVVVGL